MRVSKRLKGMWIMAMTLLSLGAFTAFFVAQMWLNLLYAAYLGLMIAQCITLVTYLWGPEKLHFRPLKVLYHIFFAISSR